MPPNYLLTSDSGKIETSPSGIPEMNDNFADKVYFVFSPKREKVRFGPLSSNHEVEARGGQGRVKITQDFLLFRI